jgi:peptide/nickel transport system substrate-binding protein
MNRNGATGIVAGIVVIALVSSACGSAASPAPGSQAAGSQAAGSQSAGSQAPATAETPAGPAEGTIRWLGLEPQEGLDTSGAQGGSTRAQVSLIADNLVEYDQDGALTLGLAASFESTADLKTWTFHLRPDLKFSDGTPITAEDVKWSVERMRKGEALKNLLTAVTEVAVVDPATIKITTSTPARKLPNLLATNGSGGIFKEAAVEGNPSYWQLPTATSGPYIITARVPKDGATYEANPEYWRKGYPKTRNLKQIYSADQNSWAAAIESGTADAAAIGYADAQRLREAGTIQIVQDDASPFAPLLWGWARDKAPFDSKLVRQAFAYAFDRQGRMDACWFGTGDVTYGQILRPWDPMYTQIDTYKLDRAAALTKAGELLDQAGWKAGSDGMRVAQGVPGEADGTKFSVEVPYEFDWPAAECNTLLLQSTMKQVGVDIKPVKDGTGNFWTEVGEHKFTMYHGGNAAIDADDLYLNWFHSGGGSTAIMTNLNDPAIDAKIDAAVAADEATAKGIYAELENWQADELPLLVTGYQYAQIGLAKNVQGHFSGPQIGLKWLANVTIGP